MSHGYAIALLTQAQAINVDAALETLLAPYEECREVPAYSTPCGCVGDAARDAARAETFRVHGDHEEQRARYAAFLERHFGKVGYFDLPTREDRERWDALVAVFWHPIRATEQAAFDAHPGKGTPCPDCEECMGIGSYSTTCNPMARWDWYVVGGRWSGRLQGKDIAPVAAVDWDDDTVPRAIITRNPCGWIERGHLGWFGASYDTTTPVRWREQARTLLAEAALLGDVAVVVDYHI